jgi:hypothetical protein
VTWTRIVRSGGPWRLNVLRLAPGVRVVAAPAGDIGERRRPSSIQRRLRGIAAVNGGYFAVDGNPAGVLMTQGRLVSEPLGGRSALLLGDSTRIARLRFVGSVRVGGSTRLLDGVDRAPGRIPACGGRGGDRPTERSDSVTTCTDPSELVAFTSDWGSRTPRMPGVVEAVVRSSALGARRSGGGTAIPQDGLVLAGTGDAARLLRRAAAGAPMTVDLSLRAGGAPVTGATDIVGGAPRLLVGGHVRIDAVAEGFAPPSAPWFYPYYVTRRQPRTLAGVRRDGGLVLVTVDGRAPGWSAGVTLAEAARVMRSLGARDALDLDGGGSSAMAVRGKVVNRPSDGVERAVSDALVVMP